MKPAGSREPREPVPLGARESAGTRARRKLPTYGEPENYPMARHLFIVARSHPDLYTYLCERFANDPNVEVILDRRVGQRRQRAMTVTEDRRTGDRRGRPEADVELTIHSHVILTVA